jgi:hypothetical protein
MSRRRSSSYFDRSPKRHNETIEPKKQKSFSFVRKLRNDFLQVTRDARAALENERVCDAFVGQMNVVRQMWIRLSQIVDERERRIGVRASVQEHVFELRRRERGLDFVVNIDDVERLRICHVQNVVHQVVR